MAALPVFPLSPFSALPALPVPLTLFPLFPVPFPVFPLPLPLPPHRPTRRGRDITAPRPAAMALPGGREGPAQEGVGKTGKKDPKRYI